MISTTISKKELRRITFRQAMWGSVTSWVALFIYGAMWKVLYDLAKVGQVKTNIPLLTTLTLIFAGLFVYHFFHYRKWMKSGSSYAGSNMLEVSDTQIMITTEDGNPLILEAAELKSISQDREWLLFQFQNQLMVPIHMNEKANLPDTWTSRVSGSFWKGVVTLYVLFTLIGGYFVWTAATNFNGALAWKLNEWKTSDKIDLQDDNIYTAKLAGILESVKAEMELEPLLMTNDLDITFDSDGTIREMYTYVYGYDESEVLQTGYLITYDANKDDQLTIHKQEWDGQGTMDYDPNNDLNIVSNMLNSIPLDEVAKWNEKEYSILYKGIRDWNTDQVDIRWINENGEINPPIDPEDLTTTATGPSISLYVPGKEDTIEPIRYVYRPTFGPVENKTRPTNPSQYQPIVVNDVWSYAIADGKLRVSSDQGKNWMETPVTTTEIFAGEYNGDETELIPGSFQFSNERLAVLVGNGNLYQSFDQGKTWEQSSIPTELVMPRTRIIGFPTDRIGYAILTGDRKMSWELTQVFLSVDSGKNWTMVTSPDDPSLLYSGGFTDEQTGFLSYGVLNPTEPRLYVTQDGGQTWNLSTITIPTEYQGVFVSAEVPMKEGDSLSLLINQGPNGDFEGGKVKGKFISRDNGLTWEFVTIVNADS